YTCRVALSGPGSVGSTVVRGLTTKKEWLCPSLHALLTSASATRLWRGAYAPPITSAGTDTGTQRLASPSGLLARRPARRRGASVRRTALSGAASTTCDSCATAIRWAGAIDCQRPPPASGRGAASLGRTLVGYAVCIGRGSAGARSPTRHAPVCSVARQSRYTRTGRTAGSGTALSRRATRAGRPPTPSPLAS